MVVTRRYTDPLGVPARGCRLALVRALFGSLAFGVLFDANQVARPEFFEAADPAFVNLPDRHHVQRVDALPAYLTRVNQAGGAEHVDVLHDAEAGQVRKGLHNLRSGAEALAQEVENRAAAAFGPRSPPPLPGVVRHPSSLHAT